jgi:replicative DNA helicase
MNGEVPESRVDTEASLCGCLLFDGPGDAERREQLFSEFSGRELSDRDLRRVFAVFERMHFSGAPMDDSVLAAEELIRDGFSAADAARLIARCLQQVPHAAHALHYAAIVKGLHQRDELAAAGMRLAAEAKDRTTEPDAILQAALQQLEEIRAGAEARTALMDAAEALKAFDERRDSVAAIRSGFSELDRLLDGGFRAGQLVVVGGRPGSGKSALMQQWMMQNAAAGIGGFYVSCEMPSSELAGRGVKAVGRERFARLPLLFSESTDLAKIVGESRLAVRRHGVRLLAADYLQLMQDGPRGRGVSREQEVSAISRGLKLLAKEMGVVVVAGSQLNRAAAAKDRPGLADLRESGAIEQDADAVILLAAGDDDGSGVRDVEAILAKNRGGACGAVNLRFDGRRFTFSEGDDEAAAVEWAANSFAGGGRR